MDFLSQSEMKEWVEYHLTKNDKENTMAKFIGVKMIDATPMNLGDYNAYRGWDIPKDEDPKKEGYLVVYPDGYQSWSPKEIFEAAYFKLSEGDKNKLSVDDLRRFAKSVIIEKIDPNTALVTTEFRNGFKDYQTGSCVDPENFDMAKGLEVGKEKSVAKLWELLGFVLCWGKNGLSQKMYQEIERGTDMDNFADPA